MPSSALGTFTRHSIANRSACRLTEIDVSADRRYEQFVASRPEAVIFQHRAWLQVLEREYGVHSLVLGCEDQNRELVGVLPLFHTRGLPLGLGGALGCRRLSSLPRTPVAGPLAVNSAVTAQLLQGAIEYAGREPGLHLEIKTLHPLPAGIAPALNPVSWRIFYMLDLPSRPEEIRFGNSNKHSQIKRGMGKALKQGLRPALAETEAELADWYAIYARTMQRNRIMARSWRLFAAMWELLRPRNLMHLWLAKRNAEVVAGVLVLAYGGTAFYGFGGWREGAEYSHANDLLHWEAIHEACRLGFRSYDFGEVPEGDAGLAQFKSKWNTRAERLQRYYYPALTFSAADSRAHLRRVAKSLWQRMPNFAARRLSDWLYGYL